jgi:hypothetical protein
MNNFVFSQDPLLFQSAVSKQFAYPDGNDLKKQYESIVAQYQNIQQQNTPSSKDYLGELDSITKNVDPDVIEKLTNDEEYKIINSELQYLIQEEILRNVKWKINNNPTAVSKIEKLMNMIQIAKKEKDDETNRNLMELNDYIKNYSSLTFDEYKELKKIK